MTIKKHYFLLDIGGTNTKYQAVTTAEDALTNTFNVINTDYDYPTFIKNIKKIKGISYGDYKFNFIAVSFGVSLSKDGVVNAASKMPSFVGKNIIKDLGEIFEAPVFIAHDCICALLSITKGMSTSGTVGYITISTGVGAAYTYSCKGHEIFQRVRLGHHTIDTNGPLCKCGRNGCLSAYIDSSYFKNKSGVGLEKIKNDEFWQKYSYYLSIGVINFIKTLSITDLYIGGGVTENTILRKYILNDIDSNCGKDGYGLCRINFVNTQEISPLHGSYFLAGNNSKFLIRG